MLGKAKRRTMRSLMIRALSFTALAALTLNAAATPAATSENHADEQITTSAIPSGSAKTRFLALGVGKSVVIDLPRDVKDVLVADPKIANAVVRSAQRAYIRRICAGIGCAIGAARAHQPDLRGRRSCRAGRQLSRQFRLHHRLRFEKRRTRFWGQNDDR